MSVEKTKTPSSSPSNRTLAQSWMALPASTRLKVSLGFCLVAVAGIYISDTLEKKFPAEKMDKSA